MERAKGEVVSYVQNDLHILEQCGCTDIMTSFVDIAATCRSFCA